MQHKQRVPAPSELLLALTVKVFRSMQCRDCTCSQASIKQSIVTIALIYKFATRHQYMRMPKLLHLVSGGVVYGLWCFNSGLGQKVCKLLKRCLGVRLALP